MKPIGILSFLLVFMLAACSGVVETITFRQNPVGNTSTGENAGSETHPGSTQPDESLSEEPAVPPDTKGPAQIDDPATQRDLEIITLLPRDAILAIDNPEYISAAEADLQYEPDELVIGVNFDGDARAYSIPKLSSHEIVNDTVGGRKIAVTW